MKYLFRILLFPFFLSIVLISLIKDTITISYEFLVYGGEMVTFKRGYKETIKYLIEQNQCKQNKH